jgi:hypothetical protein
MAKMATFCTHGIGHLGGQEMTTKGAKVANFCMHGIGDLDCQSGALAQRY